MNNDSNMTFKDRYILRITIFLTALLAAGSTMAQSVRVNGSVFGGGNAADVKINTTVNISAGNVDGNVYGGGNLGDVGTYTVSQDGRDYTWQTINDVATGKCTVTITGGTIGAENIATTNHASGHVFGAGKGVDDNFKCDKAMLRETNVTISNGTVWGNVYGGGQIGRVDQNTTVKIGNGEGTDGGTVAPDIKGSVFGAGAGVETHGYSALVRGNTDVTVEGNAKVKMSVYGGGEIAAVGKYGLDEHNMPTTLLGGGECKVFVRGHAEVGHDNGGGVFGAGEGVVPHYYPIGTDSYDDTTSMPKRMTMYDADDYPDEDRTHTWDWYDQASNLIWEYFDTRTKYLDFLQTLALATDTKLTIDGHAKVHGSVYGGSRSGFVQRYTDVKIQGYCEILTTGTENGKAIDGNVFGGGKGLTGNDAAGRVRDGITLYVLGGTVNGDVYGGGALAKSNTWIQNDVYPTTTVNLLGGTITGDAYGGGLGNATTAADAGNTKVNLNGMALSEYNAVPAGDLKTYLGTILTALDVNKDEDTSDEGVDYFIVSGKGCSVSRIFGANNTNGTPKDNVTVHVYATQNKLASKTNIGAKFSKDVFSEEAATLFSHLTDSIAIAKGLELPVSSDIEALTAESSVQSLQTALSTMKTSINDYVSNAADPDVAQNNIDAIRYDVKAVYGGGNEAAYIPVTPNTSTTSTVNGAISQIIIDGCDYTSIETVYGGGNAAAVPETNVDIRAAYEIQEVFGGGNGKDATSSGENPGADVGTKDHGVSDANNYGTGNANTVLKGGCIHETYGGSNQKGVIKGSINQTSNPDESTCELELSKVVGAGKYADIDANVNIILSCQPEKKIDLLFAGADEANVNGNISLTITNGNFGKVFGGNNLGGVVKGTITVNVEETGCRPINIDELYLGGNEAAYSVYGYYDSGETHEVTGKNILKPRESSEDQRKPVQYDGTEYASIEDFTNYNPPVLNIISCTSIGKVFGGGYGTGAVMYATPTVNINMIKGLYADRITATSDNPNNLGAIGTVYGGGNAADVIGNPTVNIGTAPTVNLVSTGATGQTVLGAYITGNVFGGGKGSDDTYECEKAMIGINGDGEEHPDGGTTVNIGNGVIGGNVYGGGEIGRVEKNSVVTIGLAGAAEGASAPIIKGNVFGGGKGKETHGYAALLRGNPTVTIQADAKVLGNVYGGGEIASVARYKVPKTPEAVAAAIAEGYDAHLDMPYALKNSTSGYCKVTVKDNAEIGPDNMKMYHLVNNAIPDDDKPDDAGHVFAAGKGILPDNYDYDEEADGHMPKRMINENGVDKWEWFHSKDAYVTFIQTLALASNTEVSIEGNAFVKGSVYGGSENGLVQYDTKVYIKGGQIGCGKQTTHRHVTDYPTVWDDNFELPANVDLECASWEYKSPYAPYDPNANATGDLDKYPKVASQSAAKSTEGGRRIATDGHTYYGNVFGGGSGSVPYFDTDEGISKYLNSAGTVKGNTLVEITGGHILTNVYGGCEATNVLGKATVKMTGGTLGVPRTTAQIAAHPVTCYLFGAGKGDQRIFFNKDTNVNDTEVEVDGGRIYGSVFGGGEDGHVMRHSMVTIKQSSVNTTKIGTTGTTYLDGNIFGGGRGFGGDALTAGNVGGCVEVNIEGGTMLGSIYGGGRLASVGYGLYLTTEDGYGEMRDDKVWDNPNKPISTTQTAEEFFASNPFTEGAFTPQGRGYITVNIKGGTIGNDVANAEYGGNVFGGSMGRLTKLDGSDNDLWNLLATAKKTTVNVTGGTIKRSVYGGGEMGTVTEDATVTVTAGTIGTVGNGGVEFGNVYGGGKGYVDPAGSSYIQAGIIKGNTEVNISEAEGKTTTIYHNIYGGGAYGSVGDFNYDAETGKPTGRKDGSTGGRATINITGGTIGTTGTENGMVFGSSRGDVGAPGSIHDKLAWVYDAIVSIGAKKADGSSENPADFSKPQIYGSVYGSGENGHTLHDTQVNIYGGTIGTVSKDDTYKVTSEGKTYVGADYPYRGNVYGGGCGTDKYASTAGGSKNTYNPLAGIVRGTTTVNISGGQVAHNVYGAGAMGSVGGSTDDGAGKTTITITGGRIGDDGDGDGNIYGAARGDSDYSGANSDNLAQVRETDVNIQYATTPDSDNADHNAQLITGSVFGGGEAGIVTGDVAVNMLGGRVLHDVYGGGALASSNKDQYRANDPTDAKTIVNLLGGAIEGDAYGGGLGRLANESERVTAVEAFVGNTKVNLNGLATADYVEAIHSGKVQAYKETESSPVSYYIIPGSATGCSVRRVFGCNNLNGTPKGSVVVHVYRTQGYPGHQRTVSDNLNKEDDNEHKYHSYEVDAVYGGGNLSAYIPKDLDEGKTHVIIEGCDLTSIRQVYGGGNAASTPATLVDVHGSYEIEEVFGGGNGMDDISLDGGKTMIINPGANVGFKDYWDYENNCDLDAYNTKEKRQTNTTFLSDYVYGSGKAEVNINSGRVHRVFGGSNTRGNVRETALTILEDEKECDFFNIDEAYGGGKSAPMDAEAKLLLSCIPQLKVVYGGAQDADISNDVVLNISNGTFDRVFGGNNKSGSIHGAITVNIEETGCKPVIIGQLYGGGNLAPYTGPLKAGSQTERQGPTVNVKAFTSIGEVYGGGFGAGAYVTGDTHVNINEVILSKDETGQTTDYSKTSFIQQEVVDSEHPLKEYEEIELSDGSKYRLWNRPVKNAGTEDAVAAMGVIGNVYGGGNEAKVIGNTYVNIGNKATETIVTLNNVEKDVKGVDIRGNVYGGGNQADVTGNTNVKVGKE